MNNRKFANFLAALLILFSSLVSGQSGDYAYEDGGVEDMFVDFDRFDFDSQWEILTEFVAPFLFLYLVFQIGLERALNFTTSTDDDYYSNDEQKKKNQRYSMALALIITLILVPTQHFQELAALTSIIFGSIVYLLLVGVFVGFSVILFKAIF